MSLNYRRKGIGFGNSPKAQLKRHKRAIRGETGFVDEKDPVQTFLSFKDGDDVWVVHIAEKLDGGLVIEMDAVANEMFGDRIRAVVQREDDGEWQP